MVSLRLIHKPVPHGENRPFWSALTLKGWDAVIPVNGEHRVNEAVGSWDTPAPTFVSHGRGEKSLEIYFVRFGQEAP